MIIKNLLIVLLICLSPGIYQGLTEATTTTHTDYYHN